MRLQKPRGLLGVSPGMLGARAILVGLSVLVVAVISLSCGSGDSQTPPPAPDDERGRHRARRARQVGARGRRGRCAAGIVIEKKKHATEKK